MAKKRGAKLQPISEAEIRAEFGAPVDATDATPVKVSTSWGLARADGPNLAGLPPNIARPFEVAISANNRRLRLAPGVYMLGAGSGVGKSLTAFALSTALARAKASDDADRSLVATTGLYFNVFEPTSKMGVPSINFGAEQLTGSAPGTNLLFYDAELFLSTAKEAKTDRALANIVPRIKSDIAYVLAALAKAGDATRAKFLVFDSLTSACMRYQARERAGQRTFRGGAQPADAEFFRNLNQMCVDNGVTTFAIVNTDVLPVTLAFEGVVEGIGEVLRPGHFTLKARAAGRNQIDVQLDRDVIDAAAVAFGYPPRAGVTNDSFFNP